MSWGDIFGDVVSTGLDIYEKKEMAKLGVSPVPETPNDGVSGTAAALPDQAAVAQPQTVGPVPPAESGTITFAGITMSKTVLQGTILLLLIVWIVGRIT
ncbi:hypothetical protein ACJJI5_12360 [Microbulbifer sp. EKSA008]|uniref:hypothetical protein n=1 Tax=Microbulbifer sp. EKSA008 TaxID=3243367 RepID=UPI0040425315